MAAMSLTREYGRAASLQPSEIDAVIANRDSYRRELALDIYRQVKEIKDQSIPISIEVDIEPVYDGEPGSETSDLIKNIKLAFLKELRESKVITEFTVEAKATQDMPWVEIWTAVIKCQPYVFIRKFQELYGPSSQVVTFDEKKSQLFYAGKSIPIPVDTKQYFICKVVIPKEPGEWVREVDIEEEFSGESDPVNNISRSIYDAMLAVNKKAKKGLGIDRLFIRKSHFIRRLY